MYYLNYFFIFSFVGHLIESLLFNKSGIFFGWWTPIYGIGVVIILLINKIIDKLKLNKIAKFMILFFSSGIILSLIEWISGSLIEVIFNTTLWDYSNLKFNIGKYMALEIALIWGISSILIIYFIKCLLDKIISKIPKYFTYILIILLILDVFLTIIIKH